MSKILFSSVVLFTALGVGILSDAGAQSNAEAIVPASAAGAGVWGTTVAGEVRSADRTFGKVAVVFYWSTACTVCINSLPELRANAQGWRSKPFVLVTVNVDREEGNWLTYEKIVAKLQPQTSGVLSLRQSDNQPVPAKLPLTLLVDTQGKVVARYAGRLAPEVWDGVADLLP